MSDEMSLALTRRIENLFAKEYVGGEVQRRAAIQCAINEVISADLAAEQKASVAWRENYDIALSEAGKAVRERDELRAVLEPFAKAADNFDTMPIKDPESWFAYSGMVSATKVDGAITVGDLRRARAALNKGGGDE